MEPSKVLILVILTVTSVKIASSFPAKHEPNSKLTATGSNHIQNANMQLFNVQLYSVLEWVPCSGIVIPSGNHVHKYETTISFSATYGGHICTAVLTEAYDIYPFAGHWIIETDGYPNSYPNKHLSIASIDCGSDSVPVILKIEINLQEAITYMGEDQCVDYVKIDPPIENHPPYYCGAFTDGDHHVLSGTSQMKVWFRTSQVDNAYGGFRIQIICNSLQELAEENAFHTCLQLGSESAKAQQQNINTEYLPFDSLDKLMNFSSVHCKPATTLSIASHLSIVRLALQSEKACDEDVKTAAEVVLQCFSPSQIALARSLFDDLF